MTSFPTTGPIAASVDIAWGDIQIVAGDEGATVVEVSPTDPANEKDRQAAEAAIVTGSDARLRVLGPRNRTGIFNKRYGSVQVCVHLAPGSDVDAVTGLGAIRVEAALGHCRAKSSAGDVRVQNAASVDLRTGIGAVVAGNIAGDAHCRTGSGAVHIDRIGGRAEVRNANGDTWIGDSGGPLRVKAANGSVRIERALGDVLATSANGDLRVGRAERGSVQLKTAMGGIEVGIATGTSALLDLNTSYGTVRNGLAATAQPAAGERTVEVHAQTSAGDIDVVRVSAGE